MKKLFFTVSLIFLLSFPQKPAYGAMPVIDYAAVAQLIEQVRHTLRILAELRALHEYATIDHLNLSSVGFREFLSNYTALFESLIEEIEAYQNGGLLGQIERLDEVYFPYHTGWESLLDDDFALQAEPRFSAIRKQILWTKVQLKHAAFVAARVRRSLPETEAELETILSRSYGTEGVMQGLKVGHELTGMVARSLETLNIQLGEFLQAHVAEGLEKNTREGLRNNRLREALSGWGEEIEENERAPLNPFGAY